MFCETPIEDTWRVDVADSETSKERLAFLPTVAGVRRSDPRKSPDVGYALVEMTGDTVTIEVLVGTAADQ